MVCWFGDIFVLMEKAPCTGGFFNGLPVCAMRERVNRYTVKCWYMLTASTTYGKMFLSRKGCVRRWSL